MSTSTIVYKTYEFEANDTPIEMWMLEVANNVDAGVDPWLDDLREEWRIQATSGFGFGPSPRLDSYVTSEDRRQLLVSYFQKTMKALYARNKPFTPEELSLLGVGGDSVIYLDDLPLEMVVDVGRQFLALVSDDPAAGPR